MTDPLGTFRDDLVHGIAQANRRARRRRVAVATSAVVLLVGAFAIATTGERPTEVASEPGPSSTTADANSTASPVPAPAGGVWGLSYEPTWHRADTDLLPENGWNSITLATLELGTSELGPSARFCPDVAITALRDMDPTDALMTITFGERTTDDLAPLPTDGFAATVPSQATDCAERLDLVIHEQQFRHEGHRIVVLVAFGSEADENTQAQMWESLSSLERVEVQGAGTHCVATLPGARLELPENHAGFDEPEWDFWGTPQLYAPLRIDGRSGERKSIWWSSEYLGPQLEQQPELAVTWQRLDIDAAPIVSDVPATNAFTGLDTGLILANNDPQDRGCWQVTGTYRGEELSYSYWADGDSGLPAVERPPIDLRLLSVQPNAASVALADLENGRYPTHSVRDTARLISGAAITARGDNVVWGSGGLFVFRANDTEFSEPTQIQPTLLRAGELFVVPTLDGDGLWVVQPGRCCEDDQTSRVELFDIDSGDQLTLADVPSKLIPVGATADGLILNSFEGSRSPEGDPFEQQQSVVEVRSDGSPPKDRGIANALATTDGAYLATDLAQESLQLVDLSTGVGTNIDPLPRHESWRWWDAGGPRIPSTAQPLPSSTANGRVLLRMNAAPIRGDDPVAQTIYMVDTTTAQATVVREYADDAPLATWTADGKWIVLITDDEVSWLDPETGDEFSMQNVIAEDHFIMGAG